MPWVATVRGQVLVGVSWPGVQVRVDGVPVKRGRGVKERYTYKCILC